MSLADAGLSLLLDPDRLSALMGRPVRATHLRAKPGVSTTAALVGEDGRPWGWIRTLTGEARVKAGKARVVADEVGLADELGEAELTGRDTVVQWGPVATDPRLARELARVARVLTVKDTTVLRYNPLRRLVLHHGDLVLRITEERHRARLEGTTWPLSAAGVPVVGPWRSPGPDVVAGLDGPGRAHPAASSRTSVWPWVPGRDASGTTDPATLRAVGEALGRLHLADPALLPDLPRRGWAQLRAAAADSVALLEQVAPGAASGTGSARPPWRGATPWAGCGPGPWGATAYPGCCRTAPTPACPGWPGSPRWARSSCTGRGGARSCGPRTPTSRCSVPAGPPRSPEPDRQGRRWPGPQASPRPRS